LRIAGIIALLAVLVAGAGRESYLSPIEMVLSPDESRLYVVCETANALAVVDLPTGKVLRRVPVGRVPKGLALSPDGKAIYIANSWDDTVSVVDTSSLEVVRTLKTGFEPNSVLIDREGKTLYAANRIGGNISVVDLASGVETRRLAAGRGASYLALSPDGKLAYSTHVLPNSGALRTAPESEITVIDAKAQVVTDRKRLHNVAGVFHVAMSADGRLGIAAQMRPKNLIPLAHVEHGAVFGHSLALFGDDVGEMVQVPIDEMDRYSSVPFGVAIAPDKRWAYITASGSNAVVVLDVERMLTLVRAQNPKQRVALANDLSVAGEYLVARIPVGSNPKGMALSKDGSRLYVANRLDDTISVVDTAQRKVAGTINLGGPGTMTAERRGEKLFHDSRFAFQGQFGCATCHIEATFDGLAWDLEPDGFGIDIVDNRLLEDVKDTAPFKWNGGNPDLETECGPRTEKFFYRSQSYNKEQLADLVTFIKSMPLRPNRFRLANGELTASQERGKAIFERTRRKDGKPIPEMLQCPVCHSGPQYTNQQLTDVGSGKSTDRSPMIDVAHLNNVVLTAPYLHDGSARTLEEIWTVFNPRDTHGVTNDLTKDELNDLIEYLKTL
jgi:YVTN family beta-propeller protein